MYFNSGRISALWLLLCVVVTAIQPSKPASHGLLGLKHRKAKKPVHIPLSLYREFQHYANYTCASYMLMGQCPHPPYGSEIVNYININRTTTQGILFRNDKAKEYIYAFPGTAQKEDVKLDHDNALAKLRIRGVSKKNCKRCRAYEGVQIAWDSITNRSMEVLDHELKKHPHYKVTIIGHSLGGAIATLATASLKGMKYPIAKTVTFGQPRVGNRHFADYIDRTNGASEKKAGKFHRVTHANDGVPRVPHRGAGYRHSRTEYWEKNGKHGGQSAHNTVRCFGQEAPNCNDGTKPKGIIDNAHGHYSGIDLHSGKCCGL